MRDLGKFATKEWLTLKPIGFSLRLLRNKIWLSLYKKARTEHLPLFLDKVRSLEGKNIALVIAFEHPWALDWQLRMAKRNLVDTTILVFDNSRRDSARLEIERVCRSNRAPYLGLPANPTRHVNRSHGMAMTWVYYNVVMAIKPRMFAYLDHDLIPVAKISLEQRLAGQPFYGYLRVNPWAWNLWAGYCMFDFSMVADLPLDFLYDFSRKLDTGGLNWDCLYRNYDWKTMHMAESHHVMVREPVSGAIRKVQVIDAVWLHIGGISYNTNFDPKAQFFRNLASGLEQGASMPAFTIQDGQ